MGQTTQGPEPERGPQSYETFLQLCCKYSHFDYTSYLLAKQQFFRKNKRIFGGLRFLVLQLVVS